MANLKPYKFTEADRVKGGKRAAIKRLNTNLINTMLTDYIEGKNEFEGVSLLDDLMTLSPKERITFLINYLPYERPKLQAIEQVVEVTELQISKEERQKRIKDILLKTG
jgi:uncharacterized protein with von Willebrand factor type A (vWA) domain